MLGLERESAKDLICVILTKKSDKQLLSFPFYCIPFFKK